MIAFLKLIILLGEAVLFFVGVASIYTIGKDTLRNLKMLKESSTDEFKGIPTSVKAVVAEVINENADIHVKVSGSIGPAISKVTESYVSLKYEVDGVKYLKDVNLINMAADIKEGDEVELLYDNLKPCNSVLADGSEAVSAKNALKVDLGMFIGFIILALVVFIKLGLR